MPAKDIYHDRCKNALIKEGWTIIANPLMILHTKICSVGNQFKL
jgi:XisH protein